MQLREKINVYAIYFSTFIVIFLLLLLTILFGVFCYKKLNFLTGLITLFIFLLIGNGFIPFYLLKSLQIYKEPQIIKWKKSNTIVVLGAGTSKPVGSDETKPSLMAFSRITTAATLYHNCKINSSHCHILISGGDPQHNGKTEAATYRETLINLGIKDSDIQLEPDSKNTFQNTKFISTLLEQQPSNQILLVSSGLTLRRALLYFSYFNIYPIPVASDFITIPFSKFPLAYNLAINDFAVHEIIGIAQFYIYNFFGWDENKTIINKNS
ncbi:putative lipoprotein transmembrane [Candidatus Rickettsiella viridis]|uniref:Putative lipoprotein transmembrane n=1 Tax=Candidatus Rickettsiella viridis TaxID=676208 RepID=A0A2Z5UUR9_9COXI|nr:putative lipoprotein transmembrane [Candidatus Rickettsiella viridis]